jgi:hypothetical protein
MNNVHDAGKPGQGSDPSSTTGDPLAIILEEIRQLSARLGSLEERLALQDKPAPGRVPLVPSLALRSDGKVLLAVEHVEGANIADRERWEGIVLSAAETAKVFNAMSGAADDAAGHVAGRILWHGKKRDSDPEEGGDGGHG